MTHPNDVIIWPCGTWCYREELHEFTHKSDDYEQIPGGSMRARDIALDAHIASVKRRWPSDDLAPDNSLRDENATERARFEAWMKRANIDAAHWLPGSPQDGYRNARVQDYWMGWLERSRVRAARHDQRDGGGQP